MSLCLMAQDYSVSNRRAIKYFEEAITEMNRRDATAALELIGRALDIEPEFKEALLLSFEAQVEMGDLDGAEQSMVKALTIDPDFFPNGHFFYGELKLKKGAYEISQVAFEKFLSYPRTNPALQEKAMKYLIDCAFAMKAIQRPVQFEPINMGANVNTPNAEYFPSLTTDDRTLLFTRRLAAENSSGAQEDFYISEKQEEWMLAMPLDAINTPMNEGAPSISPDGKMMFFTACQDEMGSYGERRKGYGSCDIFYSIKEGTRWSAPENLGEAVNSRHWETQPSFSSDGRTLYFIRGYKNGIRIEKEDIWMSQLDEAGAWTKAERLSEVVNSPGSESAVSIHPDGKTLYFSSTGHPGMGGEDIYMSKKDEDGQWTTPVNLGYPINTFKNENSLTVTAQGDVALFASDRAGGFGELDLYSFELPSSMRPERVTYMEGKVIDTESKRPIGAQFQLLEPETGAVIIESFSDALDGSFLVSLPVGRTYALMVKKKGYLFYSEHFDLPVQAKPYRKTVELSPINEGERVILNNVFFNTDSDVLSRASMAELGELVGFLNKNYRLKIELGGHTDDQGTSGYNEDLSLRRAKAVKAFLIDKGIPEERLTAKGYGAEVPIASNTSEEGRAKNRRTEFKVIALD